ncbi:hypothetical protein pipiens_001931 [Culex pipiens pipiens]|uniref:Secreted protein n=1 Tax=Culex pipiens pipiens TaxID=38569 RepID=A0ABD1DTS0_CULPP
MFISSIEMMKSTLLGCFIIVLWPPQITSLQSMNFQLERAEQIGGQDFADWQLRVRKFNRTTFTLNRTATFLQDLDESYEVTISFAYSSLGNNQFNEYPMKLPRKKVCRYMVEEYREFQYVWAGHTNMPQVDKGARVFCPYPKGTYWSIRGTITARTTAQSRDPKKQLLQDPRAFDPSEDRENEGTNKRARANDNKSKPSSEEPRRDRVARTSCSRSIVRRSRARFNSLTEGHAKPRE